MSILEIAPLVRGAYLARHSISVFVTAAEGGTATASVAVEALDELPAALASADLALPGTLAVTVGAETLAFTAGTVGDPAPLPHGKEADASAAAARARVVEGKVAVVTAAGQGIGRAIAEAFVAEGATVEVGAPIVLIDEESPEYPCSVRVDHVEGGRQAARHLIGLGHRRLAFVGGRPDLGQFHQRSYVRVLDLHKAHQELQGHIVHPLFLLLLGALLGVHAAHGHNVPQGQGAGLHDLPVGGLLFGAAVVQAQLLLNCLLQGILGIIRHLVVPP